MRKYIFQALLVLFLFLVIFSCILYINIDSIANHILHNTYQTSDDEPPPTAHAINYSVEDIAILGGQGSGISCSIDPFIQWFAFSAKESESPPSLQMRQACSFHDFCYRHGAATYGYTQSVCDYTLQEHAFRLCKKIYGQNAQELCQTMARKIVLGVRIGGSESYKSFDKKSFSSEKSSTYFEFDPLPQNLQSYQVIRVADAPSNLLKPYLSSKAIYIFSVKPSGLTVEISIPKIDGSGFEGSSEAPIRIPGSYTAITNAPTVIHDYIGGDDWFVFNQRESVASTSSRLTLLKARDAGREDWRAVADDQQSCTIKGITKTSATFKNKGIIIGCNLDQKLRIGEFHAVQAGKNDDVLEFLGLTGRSCSNIQGETELCVMHLKVNVKSGDISLEKFQDSTGRDDRYRMLASQPFISLIEDNPVLSWLRRGIGADGKDYQNYSTLRTANRFSHTEKENVVKVTKLNNLTENDEPIQMLFPDGPPSYAVTLRAASEKFGAEVDLGLLNVNNGVLAYENCLKGMDNSWIKRPPTLIREFTNSYRVIFSRWVPSQTSKPKPTEDASFQITQRHIQNGICSQSTSSALSDIDIQLDKKYFRMPLIVSGNLLKQNSLSGILVNLDDPGSSKFIALQ